ncbi:hypothetical protein B0H12DRAFT_1140368 [Mycena haematopus]|nr:hypothetical protein B0H12DRAFT_1140368 [Mycena haematopus]
MQRRDWNPVCCVDFSGYKSWDLFLVIPSATPEQNHASGFKPALLLSALTPNSRLHRVSSSVKKETWPLHHVATRNRT